MKNDTKYDLTEEEYNACLGKAEVNIFVDSYAVENPRSLFIVAQPGAGKTGLRACVMGLEQIKEERIRPTDINPDSISTHHKYYKEIMEEFPDDSYRILQRFTQPALDTYLRQRAVEIGCDLLQEGTFASTQGYIDIIKFQRNGGKAAIGKMKKDGKREVKEVKGGYNVRIYCLAVNRFESLLSCIEREQGFIESGLPVRVVTIENHDRAYKNMLVTLDKLEKEKLFDELQIYKRGIKEDNPELILEYDENNKRYPRISDYIIAERERQEKELFRNPQNYLERIYKLKEIVKKNSDNNAMLARLEKIEEMFNRELEKNENMHEEH